MGELAQYSQTSWFRVKGRLAYPRCPAVPRFAPSRACPSPHPPLRAAGAEESPTPSSGRPVALCVLGQPEAGNRSVSLGPARETPARRLAASRPAPTSTQVLGRVILGAVTASPWGREATSHGGDARTSLLSSSLFLRTSSTRSADHVLLKCLKCSVWFAVLYVPLCFVIMAHKGTAASPQPSAAAALAAPSPSSSKGHTMLDGLKNNTISKLALSRFLSQSL